MRSSVEGSQAWTGRERASSEITVASASATLRTSVLSRGWSRAPARLEPGFVESVRSDRFPHREFPDAPRRLPLVHDPTRNVISPLTPPGARRTQEGVASGAGGSDRGPLHPSIGKALAGAV